MGGNSVFLAIVKIIKIICNFQKRRKDTTFFLILQTFSKKSDFLGIYLLPDTCSLYFRRIQLICLVEYLYPSLIRKP